MLEKKPQYLVLLSLSVISFAGFSVMALLALLFRCLGKDGLGFLLGACIFALVFAVLIYSLTTFVKEEGRKSLAQSSATRRARRKQNNERPKSLFVNIEDGTSTESQVHEHLKNFDSASLDNGTLYFREETGITAYYILKSSKVNSFNLSIEDRAMKEYVSCILDFFEKTGAKASSIQCAIVFFHPTIGETEKTFYRVFRGIDNLKNAEWLPPHPTNASFNYCGIDESSGEVSFCGETEGGNAFSRRLIEDLHLEERIA